jgi:hypothetical protein
MGISPAEASTPPVGAVRNALQNSSHPCEVGLISEAFDCNISISSFLDAEDARTLLNT